MKKISLVTILGALLIACGCASIHALHSPEIAQLHAACEAFMAKASDDREAEADALATAIQMTFAYNYTKTEVSPGVWVEEFDSKKVTSPIRESDIIRLIGEPDHRYGDSISYAVRKYRAAEGRQAKFLVIHLRKGMVVDTGIELMRRYH